MTEPWKRCTRKTLSLLFTLALLFSSSNQQGYNLNTTPVSNSGLEEILERGKLIAVTDPGSTSYFVFRGEPMGYQFDLLKLFALHLGVELEIYAESDTEVSLEKLGTGQYDLIAKNLAITQQRQAEVDFSEPIMNSRMVLVQAKPFKWRQMRTAEEIEANLIRNNLALVGRTLHIPRNQAIYNRLQHLQKETGAVINVVVEDEFDSEDLIAQVARREIDFTVTYEHIARVAAEFYPELDVQTPLSLVFPVAWAVGKGNETLLNALNEWVREFKNTLHARLIYDRYFNNPRGLHAGMREYHSQKGGSLSRYDDVIRNHSAILGWDWRLIASLIYQESRFRHDQVSLAGAFGIMQMMPATAAMFGIDTTSTAPEQIVAGIRYLAYLDRQFSDEILDPTERKKFVLAAYNGGIAHVWDARRLAEKNNRNPNIWEGNVDYFLLNKSRPEYYTDSVVRYGYSRGEEPYNFVIEILERYGHYRSVVRN